MKPVQLTEIGDLRRVVPYARNNPGWTTLWESNDPNDAKGLTIEAGSIVLVVNLSHPYAYVITSEGVGWLHVNDTKIIRSHN